MAKEKSQEEMACDPDDGEGSITAGGSGNCDKCGKRMNICYLNPSLHDGDDNWYCVECEPK